MNIDNHFNQQLAIGMMLNFPEAAILGTSKLTDECFSSLEFVTIFRIIKTQINKNKVPTVYSVNNDLEKQGKVVSLDELITIRQEFYVPQAFESVIDNLLDVAQRRIAISTLKTVIDGLQDSSIEVKDSLKEIGNIQLLNSSKEVMDSTNYVEKRKQQDFRKKHIKEIRSGFDKLDEALTYRFPGGEISIIAARPGNGKSITKANFIANYCSQQTEIGVASYALEQTLLVESDRLESIVSGIPLTDIARNKLWIDSDPRWERLNASRSKIAGWNHHLLEGIGKSTAEILSEVRNLYNKHNVRLFFFDLFDRISDISNAVSDKPSKVGQTMNAFLEVAKELDIHFCLLVQINRDAVKSKRGSGIFEKKKPELHELKGSGSYEEFARTVILLHNPKAYDHSLQKSVIEIIIAKQNNGPLVDLEFDFNTENLRITSNAMVTKKLKGGEE